MNNTSSVNAIYETAKLYSEATGISCSVISPAGGNPEEIFTCSFCSAMHQCGCSGQDCMETHRKSAHQSERFGGSYVYFCEGSLLFWASPVVADGVMVRAFIAGPVLAVEPEDILEEIADRCSMAVEEILHLIEKVPRIDISKAHSLSEVLRMCAGWVSGYQEHTMLEHRNQLDQLSKVSEYIQELKERTSLEDPRPSACYPLDKEEELRQVIRVGDKATAQKLLNELLGIIFFSSGSSIERIKFRVMELIILLSRAALEGGAPENEIMEISFASQREISRLTSTEAIALWLSRVLHDYTSLVFDTRSIKHGDSILRALQFIHQHYTEKITLQNISDHVFLSPTYFSKIFNEEMNCTVTSYINQLRTAQAKSLLRNTRYSLVDIAGIVGFDDQSYFSRVFKAITGVTPGGYRKRAGSFPDATHEIHDKPT